MSVATPIAPPALSLVTPEPTYSPSTALARSRAVSFSSDGYTQAADGTRLHHYTVGEKDPPLVCCDGIGCDGYVWKYIAEDLAYRHRIVRWHYRAHGLSGKPSNPERMTMADLVDDLLRVLDAQAIDRAVLVGHSLGVQVILEAHRRHPDRVLALVPMCGSYGYPLDTFKDSTLLKRMLPIVSRLVRRFPNGAASVWKTLDSELAYQVALMTEVNGNLVRHKDFRGYFTHLGAMEPRLFVKLLEDAAQHDTLPHLDKIDVPTLIVAGERDGFTPSWLSAIMNTRIRNSELCTVPMGTHTAPIEMPELVTLRLRRFLDERVLPLVQDDRATSH